MKTTASEGQALHTIPEAAARLRVSRATIYRLIASGELSTVTVRTERSVVRGLTRIPSAAIDAYIAKHDRVAS